MPRTAQPDFSPDPALDSRLAELRDRFKGVLPERIRTVRSRLLALTPDARGASAIEDLRLEVHSLAGSSGLFGFDDVGAAAGELERLAIAVAKSGALSHAAREELLAAMSQLEQAAHRSAV